MSTVDHLTELLDQKTEELRAAKERLAYLEEREETRPSDWLVPKEYKPGEDPCPNSPWPRIHMTCEQLDGSWDRVLWTHYLVFRNMLGKTVYWPLGTTTENRRSNDPSAPAVAPERVAQALPMRQGKDAELLALQLRIPLTMEADGRRGPIQPQQFVRENYERQKGNR